MHVRYLFLMEATDDDWVAEELIDDLEYPYLDDLEEYGRNESAEDAHLEREYEDRTNLED